MQINNKKRLSAAFMAAILAGSVVATSTIVANANTASGSPEEQADITNWIANTPQQVSNNMAMQHIDTNNLDGVHYIIQWGDTLSSISSATGISVAKLCYDNNIQNANLIYAGDVLILNREGDVPAGYNPNVNPNVVAQTKVTINNGPAVVNINVQPTSVKKYINTDNSDHSTNYKAGDDNSTTTVNNNSGDSDDESSSSTTSHKHHSSVTASAIVDGLNDANTDDNLSFEEATSDDDIKDADELDIDSADILKAAKKDNYDELLSDIKAALDEDKSDSDVTIYIEKDGKNVKVYASYSDDSNSSKDSSSDEDSDSSQSSSSEDKDNSQATTDDQDTDTTDVDE